MLSIIKIRLINYYVEFEFTKATTAFETIVTQNVLQYVLPMHFSHLHYANRIGTISY